MTGGEEAQAGGFSESLKTDYKKSAADYTDYADWIRFIHALISFAADSRVAFPEDLPIFSE
jgi:hypothetical protein